MAFLLLKINHSAQSRKNNLQYCLTRFFVMAYGLPAPHKTGAGFSSLNVKAGSRYISVMQFSARNSTLPRIMAGRNGEVVRPSRSFDASLLTLLRPATMFSSVLAKLRKSVKGAARWLYQHALILSGALCSATVKIFAFIPLPLPVSEARALLPASVWSLFARIRVREACNLSSLSP